MRGKREFGDYQTPAAFAERFCRFLKEHRHVAPSAVVEPTCGVGNILKSSLMFQANEYYGIEINPEYCRQCRDSVSDERVKIIHADFFSFSIRPLISDKSRVLVIGNPPWVTNSTLSALDSDNLPRKANFKGLKGLDAMTGASNFDICEYMILRLIYEFRDTNAVIAMLCKTSVSRNIFQELKRNGVAFSSCEMIEFSAFKVFGVHADACILLIQLSDQADSSDICNVYDMDDPETTKTQLVYSDGKLCCKSYAGADNFDGQCCFEWRQGIKHDCSKVMELSVQNGMLQNGQKQTVQIEDSIVFPLIKSSMFKAPVIHSFSKYVIVTQRKAREKTEHLEKTAPKTWAYLNDNIKQFESRKSSIYRDAPPFSMFGVGDYSYSQYKVGVSGFYKRPLFSVLYSDDNKPVMTDDTSYFICFDSYDMAYVAMLLLNSRQVQKFLTGIAFLDAKRPYTKKVLERIDFEKIVGTLTIDDLTKTERDLGLSLHVTAPMYKRFQSSLSIGQMRLS